MGEHRVGRLTLKRDPWRFKIGVHPRTLERWEQGRSKPNDQAAALICGSEGIRTRSSDWSRWRLRVSALLSHGRSGLQWLAAFSIFAGRDLNLACRQPRRRWMLGAALPSPPPQPALFEREVAGCWRPVAV
jgi:hypothetical protein